MAVVIDKSTAISNRDAIPKVLTDAFVSGGEVLESEGYVAPANGDSAGSKYLFCSVPSNARLSSLVLQCTALGAGAKLDLGASYPSFIPKGAGLDAILPNAVISANFFAAALDVSAALAPADVAVSSGSYTIAKQELPLWAALGLAADPGIELDIVGTVNVAIAAAGFIGVKAKYVKQ